LPPLAPLPIWIYKLSEISCIISVFK
jgi:hypothetical protein